MKKSVQTSLLLVATVLLTSLTSCTKDGVYKPKEKISRIYKQYAYGGQTSDKVLAETWFWDDDKVTQINYSGNSSSLLTYDGKRLIEIKTGNNSTKLIYDGSKLNSVEYYKNSILDATIEVKERKGQHITKLFYKEASKSAPTMENLQCMFTDLRLIFPAVFSGNTNDKIEAIVKQASESKATKTCEVTIKYDKDNVVEESWAWSEGNSYVFAYTFDKNTNPFYKFLKYVSSNSSVVAFSKNNIVTENQTITSTSGTTNRSMSYTYQYDGKLPVESRYNTTIGGYPVTYITYFEYN